MGYKDPAVARVKWREWYERNKEARQAYQRERDRDPRRKASKAAYMRTYGRRRYLDQAHGLTPDEYETLYREQEGRCAICREWKARLDVDHDHATSRRRGLLCRSCNFGLGYFHDDPERLKAALGYIGK